MSLFVRLSRARFRTGVLRRDFSRERRICKIFVWWFVKLILHFKSLLCTNCADIQIIYTSKVHMTFWCLRLRLFWALSCHIDGATWLLPSFVLLSRAFSRQLSNLSRTVYTSIQKIQRVATCILSHQLSPWILSKMRLLCVPLCRPAFGTVFWGIHELHFHCFARGKCW